MTTQHRNHAQSDGAAIQRTAELVQQITAASKEQDSGADQIKECARARQRELHQLMQRAD